MSKRVEIKGNLNFDKLKIGLVYTEVLGWLDMGHAGGDDIALLKQQFEAGENSGNKRYSVIYTQNMRVRSKTLGWEGGTGKFTRWDYYGAIGGFKNNGFRPVLFPDPKDPCVKHEPYKVNLPHFMTWIHPWSDFTSGKVRVMTDNGTSFSLFL